MTFFFRVDHLFSFFLAYSGLFYLLFGRNYLNELIEFLFRYLDIFLGLLLLLAMASLLYGSYNQLSLFIIVFLAFSLAVVIVYWCWYFYTQYFGGGYTVFQEGVRTISDNIYPEFLNVRHARHGVTTNYCTNSEFCKSCTFSLNIFILKS